MSDIAKTGRASVFALYSYLRDCCSCLLSQGGLTASQTNEYTSVSTHTGNSPKINDLEKGVKDVQFPGQGRK